METVESAIVNIHGSLSDREEVPETPQLVIAASTLQRTEWVRVRAFSWMTAFLYFDKLLQIPLTLLHALGGVGYRELLELFSERAPEHLTLLREIGAFFVQEARKIQAGGPEYTPSKDWLGIWWPADEYLLIKLTVEGRIDEFYAQAEEALSEYAREHLLGLEPSLLHESILLNRSLLKRPFQSADLTLELSSNLW